MFRLLWTLWSASQLQHMCRARRQESASGNSALNASEAEEISPTQREKLWGAGTGDLSAQGTAPGKAMAWSPPLGRFLAVPLLP